MDGLNILELLQLTAKTISASRRNR